MQVAQALPSNPLHPYDITLKNSKANPGSFTGKKIFFVHSGCGHERDHEVRCDPVYFGRKECKGRRPDETVAWPGDCEPCREKKISKANGRIKEGRARLSQLGEEKGVDYLEELRARMRAEGYLDY